MVLGVRGPTRKETALAPVFHQVTIGSPSAETSM